MARRSSSTADGKARGGAKPQAGGDALALFHPITAQWFREALGEPTAPQREGWPAIARGESTLILAPTGTGKTLTAFLWCLDQLMFAERNTTMRGCRVVYLSPLKALAADVEKNLQRPLEGIAAMARQEGVAAHAPQITMRTGDTPARERARFLRHPGEILITTPESLYLMLTSRAGEMLRTVETVIVDEIHAMVPTKRGAHLALSLERMEALVRASGGRVLQRIGLSATQRPLEEVARFLGGAESRGDARITQATESSVGSSPLAEEVQSDAAADAARFRPVTIVNAGAKKRLELRVEVPVEDMARLSLRPEDETGDKPKRTSIWQSIYPRLLEIVRERQSTLIFVNARRIAERMANAINELAGEPIARAHHGSLAAAQRKEIEDLLKAGEIKALVATSSLELGIDMGAIDLVIQVEAPPSVASGMQRIGRAGHQVGAASNGILIPKYRSDLVACAAVTQAMHEGHVESTRYLRNPLDVLAQQIVAVVAHPPMSAAEAERYAKRGEEDDVGPGIAYQELYALVCGAAPFAGVSRAAFNGVLDMLSGLYPSDDFAELRPRVTWDRERGWLTPRAGVKRIAILNGGTIPDRGLYGVFLAGERDKPVRVGELDEEMVFESRAGEVFLLGASAWRIEEILQDRVLVTPAPGEAGKMPFWHGDRAGRPMEFGRRIGALVRELRTMPQTVAIASLVKQHDLDANAAENLLQYLADQQAAVEVVPDDATVLIERVRDELGFWRVCVLTPFGSRIHAPWSMAAAAKVALAGGPPDVETMWGEDGFVLRFPDTEEAPGIAPFLLSAAEASELVTAQLGQTSLFAAKFREAASRALLLPRRRMDGRTPLWQQRKRAYDLLSVASRFASFPILLEAYRECLRDVFDMPALAEVLRGIETGTLAVRTADSQKPSPFASALLFSYVANYIYDGDAPLAERRAQALAIDQEQLRELLGDADLRELLDAQAIEETEQQLQALAEGYRVRGVDGVHDLLLRIGDLSPDELQKRVDGNDARAFVTRLLREKRALEVEIGGTRRLIAVEDAGRYRDALGVALPKGLPEAFLARVPEAALDLVRRYARTHGPLTAAECAQRFGLETPRVEALLEGLVATGRMAEGGFRPGGVHREWCDVEVLRTIRRRSLARLRKEVEPVDQQVLARVVTRWQGVVQPRRGLDALLDAIESLQGAAVPASILETEILPARISGYKPEQLDTLIAAGEVVWVGMDALGERDGRVGLYLAERLGSLWARQFSVASSQLSEERDNKIVAYLRERGASFFQQVHDGVGGGFPGETLDALWRLVWRGLVLNDTMHALRAYTARPERQGKRVHVQGAGFRSRRTTPPAAQGRWSVNAAAFVERAPAADTAWSHAVAQQLLTRYGVVFRETAHAEGLPGGFSAVYDVLKAMEESGKVRRGYFVAELGATQFALPAAVELLRTLRAERAGTGHEMVMLAATDPANPYGALLKWPETDANRIEARAALTRSVGARVVLCDGCMVMYLRRGNANVQVFLPEEEPERGQMAKALAEFLVARVRAERDESSDLRAGLVIATVNGVRAGESAMAKPLLEAGFAVGAMGFYVRRVVAHTEKV
ncbi:MAG TPA: DEAD/DEAH box helicase [Acidobacteriaceae bacterium]|nr:DEAD/DEAH box helicase [Acidobacteriaceae bacterium]